MPVSGYKILGQVEGSGTLYTVPAGTSTTVTSIFVCNTNTQSPASFTIRVVKAGEADSDKQRLFSSAGLLAKETLQIDTKITLAAGDSISVLGTSVSFNAFGHTEYEALSINELQNIVAKLAAIDANLTKIESHQNIVKNLAVGDGIHIVGPYEWLTYSTIYNLLVEKGTILDDTDEVTAANQAKAITELKAYIAKLKVFDKWAA